MQESETRVHRPQSMNFNHFFIYIVVASALGGFVVPKIKCFKRNAIFVFKGSFVRFRVTQKHVTRLYIQMTSMSKSESLL